MAPPALTASSTPFDPYGAKPWLVKLCVLKWVKISTMIVSVGMTTFQVVMALLACMSRRTP